MRLVFDPTTIALAAVVVIGLAIALGLLAAEPERTPVPVPAAAHWRHRRPHPRPRPAVLIGVVMPKLKRLAVPVVVYVGGVATGLALTGGLLWWASGPARQVGASR